MCPGGPVRQEAQVIARLEHPNIIPIYAYQRVCPTPGFKVKGEGEAKSFATIPLG